MASAPSLMENANTASIISHRRRASRPPAVALSRKRPAAAGKKASPHKRTAVRKTVKSSKAAARSAQGDPLHPRLNRPSPPFFRHSRSSAS